MSSDDQVPEPQSHHGGSSGRTKALHYTKILVMGFEIFGLLTTIVGAVSCLLDNIGLQLRSAVSAQRRCWRPHSSQDPPAQSAAHVFRTAHKTARHTDRNGRPLPDDVEHRMGWLMPPTLVATSGFFVVPWLDSMPHSLS